ncbi:MAG: Rieske 2Fe-2S domain-containing protein [Rhodobiaceae bacterium]|nr:Rieske 2Fe-2S domain-containing protein [Rhodobiaceae bacterium]
MTEYYVCDVDDLGEKDRRVVECGDRQVGVFKVGGEIHAWFNRCAHMRGPVCQGRIYHRVLEPVAADKTVRTMQHSETDVHIVCPWHGYEYNLKTGKHPANPRLTLRRAKHVIRDGKIFVDV